MIRVVGANPALDHVTTWQPIRLGEVNRAITVVAVPGGKGFNVARALVRLGETPAAYGFLGGHIGDALRELIAVDGVHDRHTEIGAETRVCFIAVEPEAKRTTVLNEPGPQVDEHEVDRFLARLREDTRPGDQLLLSGSLPDSVPPTVAGEIIDVGVRGRARVICDIHGPALAEAVKRRPWIVKCNRAELAALLGERPSGPVVDQMRRLRDRGIEVVIVTMGPDGAVLADGEGTLRAQVPVVEPVNVTGCGDLFLAGLAAALQAGDTPREALKLAAACGTAGATTLRPELPDDFDAAAWRWRISVEPG